MPETKKTAAKIGYLLMALGVLLIAAAAALVVYNRGEDAQAGSAAEEVLPGLVSAIGDGGADDTADGDAPAAAATIDGYEYIGYLSVPALELELPVMADWDYTRLKIAPCRYYGSAETNDLVICGHNYTRHFGRLKNLKTGDLVTFTGTDGMAIAYEVREIETLRAEQITEMIESGYDLTLYTCTYSGQSRVTVRCSRTEE